MSRSQRVSRSPHGEPAARRSRGSFRARVLSAAILLAVTVVIGVACARPASAARTTYAEGAGGHAFSLKTPLTKALAVAGATGAQRVGMVVGELASYGAGSPGYVSVGLTSADPRGVQALPDSRVLIADTAGHAVVELDAAGVLLWTYRASEDPALQAPVCARRLDDGRTLIVDRDAARVFIVDVAGKLKWQYGVTGQPGSAAGRLDQPAAAEVLADGNVVIADAGNHRVIVVRAGDYAAGAAANGFADQSVVWQYGTTGVPGGGVDQLQSPSSVQTLTTGPDAGNVLICDAGAGRVLEVRAADYSAGAARHGFTDQSVVWRFPESAGAGPAPTSAVGVYGGDATIWIAAAGQLLGVATGSGSPAATPSQHQVFASYRAASGALFAGSVATPVALSLADDGSLVVADPGRGRVSVVGAKAVSAAATSKPLTCGASGRKRFVSFTCTYAAVPGAPIGVSYSIDGGPWKTLLDKVGGSPDMTADPGAVTLLLPPKTAGTTIAYTLSMAAGQRAAAPALLSIAVTSEPAASGGGSGGGGEGGDDPNSNGGSGSYSYPSSSGGSGSGSGGGTGGGSGSGSGSGGGGGSTQGYGSGSTGTTAGGDGMSATGKPTAGSALGAELPSVVAPATTGGDPSTAQVSGYVMRASGIAGGGEGGGASPSIPVRTISFVALGAGLLVAVVLAGPVAAQRRKIRLFADYDEKAVRTFPADRTTRVARLSPPPIVSARRPW